MLNKLHVCMYLYTYSHITSLDRENFPAIELNFWTKLVFLIRWYKLVYSQQIYRIKGNCFERLKAIKNVGCIVDKWRAINVNDSYCPVPVYTLTNSLHFNGPSQNIQTVSTIEFLYITIHRKRISKSSDCIKWA